MKIGSLFSGFEGLTMGVQAVLGGAVAWVSDIDPGANKILAYHWTDVPNIGDITTVDWSTVEPIDVLTAGFPCQDVSLAGRRAGMREGNRSGLWSVTAEAIDYLRPSLVVIENVKGLLSAGADCDVEPCPWCMGNGDGEPVLRALGGVVGELADIGYDTAWHGLTAASVGAPHGRFRVFIIAWPANANPECVGWERWPVEHLRTAGGNRTSGRVAAPGSRLPADSDGPGLEERFGVGGDTREECAPVGGSDFDPAVTLLKTPTAQLAVPGGSQHPDKRRAVAAATGGAPQDSKGKRDLRLDIAHPSWGVFEPAIRRWETVLGRPAPAPTELAPRGGQRLSPGFVEFLMGLPAGHVTDPVIGLTRNEQLKALGNGVVVQQAEAAIRYLLAAVS